MKILLTALNAKFIHSNLAIRYLSSYCIPHSSSEIVIREFTINDQLEKILAGIYMEKPDVIGFSCYIWNIEQILMLASSLKKVMPSCRILLGGPEVSYDGYELMDRHPYIDFIISGEGEETFKDFVQTLESEGRLSLVEGLIYREDGEIVENSPRPLIADLDKIPFPYDDELSGLENKIIYYETSRGCPFNCQYCLSSTMEGVRFFSLDRVFKEIDFFIERGVRQVKLVDRTFNCNPRRAKAIIEHIIERGGQTNFHFEIAAHLVDDEMIELFNRAPLDLFQLEIGVQSTNEHTLDAIERKTNIEKIGRVVKALREPRNIHIHLDLIAGLPYEDYDSFGRSFDDVYAMKPDNLQLGFLKLLKGSGLREMEREHGYRYTTYSPYEVLKNDYMEYGDILRLKAIEDLLDKYHNSHRFDYTLEFLVPYFEDSPFAFFEEFIVYWLDRGLFRVSHSLTTLYEIIYDFVEGIDRIPTEVFKEVLRFDYCLWQRPSRYPECIQPHRLGNDDLREFLDDEKNIDIYLPEYEDYTRRQLTRAVHMEIFKYDPTSHIEGETTILFDYKVKSLDGTQFFILD